MTVLDEAINSIARPQPAYEPLARTFVRAKSPHPGQPLDSSNVESFIREFTNSSRGDVLAKGMLRPRRMTASAAVELIASPDPELRVLAAQSVTTPSVIEVLVRIGDPDVDIVLGLHRPEILTPRQAQLVARRVSRSLANLPTAPTNGVIAARARGRRHELQATAETLLLCGPDLGPAAPMLLRAAGSIRATDAWAHGETNTTVSVGALDELFDRPGNAFGVEAAAAVAGLAGEVRANVFRQFLCTAMIDWVEVALKSENGGVLAEALGPALLRAYDRSAVIADFVDSRLAESTSRNEALLGVTQRLVREWAGSLGSLRKVVQLLSDSSEHTQPNSS